MYLFFCLVQKLKDRRLLEYVRYTQLNVFRIYIRDGDEVRGAAGDGEGANEGAAPTRRFEALSLALGCRLKSVKQSALLH